MSIPADEQILVLLDRLENETAEDLESYHLEFKPWANSKSSMKVAREYAVCFSNADGGAIVFGVLDCKKGRSAAIHGG